MSAADEGRSLGKLVSEATEELSGLMRDEIALLKAELKQDVRKGGMGAVLGALAAAFAVLALLPLTLALGFWLEAWWKVPMAIAFLIVGGLYLLGTAVLGLAAVAMFKRGPAGRDRTASLKESVAVLNHAKPHPREQSLLAKTPADASRR